MTNGNQVDDLRLLDVDSSDVLTMTCDAFASGCEGLGIGLSVKIAPNQRFVVAAISIGA